MVPAQVAGVELIRVPMIKDLRGNLVAREMGRGLPFPPARSFVVFDVPTKEVRGEHAHRRCAQLLICLRGSVVVLCDDGRDRQEFLLDDLTMGLHLPPMVWGTQYRYTQDAMLLVLASLPYDPADYIREYDTVPRRTPPLRPGAERQGVRGGEGRRGRQPLGLWRALPSPVAQTRRPLPASGAR